MALSLARLGMKRLCATYRSKCPDTEVAIDQQTNNQSRYPSHMDTELSTVFSLPSYTDNPPPVYQEVDNQDHVGSNPVDIVLEPLRPPSYETLFNAQDDPPPYTELHTPV